MAEAKESEMKEIWRIAWQRFSIHSTIIAELNGRFIATAFYFSVLVPFGLLSTLFMDPLRRRAAPKWLERAPLPADIAAAKEQG